MGIGDERSFPQIISVHFTLTTKESTIPSRGVNQCMKSSCKRKNKFIAFAGGSWLALNKELKQHRRRRLRKRHLKSEVALLQTLSRLFHRAKFVKFWQFFFFFWSWIPKDCIEVQEKKKKVVVLCSRSKHFHVAVVQWRQRNVQKSVIHVQSCCFANLSLLLFCRSRCRRPQRCSANSGTVGKQ